jgi:hypothetical protein
LDIAPTSNEFAYAVDFTVSDGTLTGRWADDKAFLAIVHAPPFSLVRFLQLDIAPTSNEFAYALEEVRKKIT